MSTLQKRFTQQELDRIKQAVKDAEEQISGEIVPVFVDRSATYGIAVYRAALALAGLAFILIIIFDRYVPSLAVYDPQLIFLIVITSAFIGALAAQYVEPMGRLLISQSNFDRTTRQRAENAFLEEEVFNTRHRTGIMIFISFFEHEVIVMADRGISKVVEQKEWDTIVSTLIGYIRQKKITDGMEVAIRRCGEILKEKGFHKTADDINELRDDLRID
jgi:putative membrane protein